MSQTHGELGWGRSVEEEAQVEGKEKTEIISMAEEKKRSTRPRAMPKANALFGFKR